MVSKWGNALVVACMGWALLCSSPTRAQVEWTTSLNAVTVAAALTQANVAAVSDGSTYVVGFANDGEATRVRLSRISAAGVVQWVRWAGGSNYPNSNQIPLLIHPDNSASVVSQDGSYGMCIENFSAAGESRSRQCDYNNADYRVTLAPDGDIYVAVGGQRSVKKISPTGLIRWSRTETTYVSGALFGAGVDTSGNYYEIQGNRMRSWGSVDGNLLNDVPLTGFYWAGYTPTDNLLASRSARDVVVVRSVLMPSNAVVTNIARHNVSGAAIWVRELVFPGADSNARISLFPADSDGVYVVRSSYGEGDSQIAKLSVSGAVLWQRHYARVRRVIEGATGLIAIRSDVSQATNSNDSFIFAVNAADGALGSPTIYSRADLFAPSQWFAVAGGVVATFQSNNPFAPYGGYSETLNATSVFIGSLAANRWVVVADKRPAASMAQSDCLMPRLGKSSPTSGWARTQSSLQSIVSDWTTVNMASGVIEARTAQSDAGCGAPITADGGRVVASTNPSERVKKISATGATVWQTPSSIYPTQYAAQPLESVAANGEVTYVLGSLLGRVSANGSLLFEAETGRANPRYVAVDSANNAWLMSGSTSSEGYVSKVSPTGALLWSTYIDTASCADGVMSALLTASDEMLVATQSCGEGRVFKVNASGQIVWQRVVSGTTLRPYVMLSALRTDSIGNIYAGGCTSNGSPANFGANAVSLLASWSNAGSERWAAQADLIGGAPECITSITTDSSNNVFAASSSSVATRTPVLWSFTSAGIERWRSIGVLSSPFAAMTELTTDSADKLIALGEAPASAMGSREVTLRRINVATLGSNLRVKFLEVPAALVGYREQFPVRIGLRTATDVAINATVNTVVSLGLQTGTGNLDGSLTCTIATGTSECTVADTRYDVVESGVTLTASTDGFATVISPPIAFRKADTNTILTAQSAAPFNAFSVVRVRASVQGPPPANQSYGGSLSGPSSPTYPGAYNCFYTNSAGALPSTDCDLLVYTAAMPLSAQFYSNDNRYNASPVTTLSLPVTKVLPTLQVTYDPGNSYVAGDRIRFRVAVMTAGGFNASRFITASSITITGGSCAGGVDAGNTNDKFAGSYRLCEIAQVPAGPLNVNIAFTGSDDLLPTNAVSQATAINPGAVIRGYAYFPTAVTVCSPTPGVTCSASTNSDATWQCVGPAGMSGQVFFVPTPASGYSFVFPGSPVSFSNVTGLQTWTSSLNWAYQSGSCKLDVDGDGAVMGMTDGVLILRRMFGLSGTALTQNATHACVPLSSAGIVSGVTLSSFDLDGDGSVKPETDGLLLLRAMLGFRGSALVVGATGATATRQTGDAIVNYLRNNCSWQINP